MWKLSAFLEELKRRRVFRVAAVYAVVAFVLVEAASYIFPALLLPNWALRLLVVLALFGFPIALVLAWAFDVTPEGVRLTTSARGSAAERDEVPETRDGTDARFGYRHLATVFAAGLLVALVGFGLASRFVLDGGGEAGKGRESRAVEAPAGTTPGVSAEPADEAPDARGERPLPLTGSAAGPSVAVLPFENLSPDPEDEYFVRGMHEAILTALSNLQDIDVTSRTSVMQYEERAPSVRKIARELGVGHVVEGSVQRAGDRVRVTAQLIDARTDRHLWAENFDREYTTDAVFDIQSGVARQIASALEARLSPAESQRLARRPTENLSAYDFYLRGQDHLRINDREAARSAVRLFHRALELDPDFALAHAGLAEAFYRLENLTGRRFWLDDSAYTAVQRALEIDPDLPEAHLILVYYHYEHGQGSRAVQQIRRVLELRPNDARAARLLARHYRNKGPTDPVAAFDQSLCWVQRAVRLEPNVVDNYVQLALSYLLLADFAGAERAAREGLELQPDALPLYTVLVHAALARDARQTALERYRAARSVASRSGPDLAVLGQIELALGRIDSARVHLAEISDRFEGFPMQPAYAEFAYALWRTGERERARELLERREAVTRPAADEGIAGFWAEFDQAEIHAIRGERKLAFKFVEEAVEQGWRHYVHILSELDTPFRELWDQPRFRRLMDRVKADVESMRLRVEREGCEAIRELPQPRRNE